MKIGVACGGTGGHIFPGLATAEVLRARGHDIVLWLAGKDIETQAVAHWEGPRHTVKSEGFQYGVSLRTVGTVVRLGKAFKTCRRLMAEDDPDVVLAMGSYASAGPVYGAIRNRIPVVLHEANVLPGRAIKTFASRATAVAACFEETRHYLPKVNLEVTGMPIRRELHDASRLIRGKSGRGEKFTLLLMGGSRGAAAINHLGAQGVVGLWRRRQDFKVIHLTGSKDESYVRGEYEKAGVDAEVHPFISDLTEIYSQTDLAICRSGAATLAELCAFAIPSLLVPYPHATHDHQTVNAQAVSRIRAADMIHERNLESAWLTEYLEGCMDASERQDEMRDALRALYDIRPAEALADVVERSARGVAVT